MKKEDLKTIHEKLLAEEQEIKRRLKPVTHKDAHEHGFSAAFPEFGSKEDENAAEVASFEDNLGLETDLQKSLDGVRTALKKIADGTYGVCENCGKPIEAKRLLAFPAARTGMSCA